MSNKRGNSNKRSYFAYLCVVFLNAFVDLGHKIVIQNAIFKSYDGQQQIILTAIVNGLILLPFILLFSPAGFLADRFPKHRIIRHAAAIAVVAVGAICFCYYQGWFWAAFALTFALAVQSAIYSPAKYGYIKELVGAKKLTAANGMVQALTISGILFGTFVFSILFESLLLSAGTVSPDETLRYIAPIGWVLLALALLEWVIAGLLPVRRKGSTQLRFEIGRYFRLGYLRQNLKVLGEREAIWLSIIGLATFWSISQVMLAAFPAFAKEALGETNTVIIQGVLACSGIGIMIGSLIAGKASKNYIETGFVPVGALGIAIGLALLPTLGSTAAMAVTFLLVGVMGGLFIVPLNAMIQFLANKDQLGTVLAGNNWVQNVAMLSALLLTVVFASLGLSSIGLFGLLTLVALIGTGYTVRKLPHSLARIVATFILKRRYRLEVVGFDNLPQTGATLLLGNHISWIDWALVQMACPRPIRFVMLKRIYDTWYLKPLFKAFGVVPIAPGNSEIALERINELLRAGECVCLFPEGAISRNGHLGKFHTGYERTLEGVDNGVIVPFYLHGLWGSSLSRAEEGLRMSRTPDFRRDLIVAFGKALPLDTGAKVLKQQVIELSAIAWQAYSKSLDSLPLTWLRTARREPSRMAIAASDGRACSAGSLVLRVRALARGLPVSLSGRVGIFMRPGVGSSVTVLAALCRGLTVVPLDPDGEPDRWAAQIKAANIQQVLTTQAVWSEINSIGAGVDLICMDQYLSPESLWRRSLCRLQFYLLPVRWYARLQGVSVNGSDAAVLLQDDNGSAHLLSHRNIAVASKQLSDVLNMRMDDVIVCSQPLSSMAGFCMSLLMPLMEGIPVLCHERVEDMPALARAIARFSATLLPLRAKQLCSLADSDTIHPLMLDSLRLAVSTDGELNEADEATFALRFGVHIYEGFGCTASAGLATLNIPDTIDFKDWKVQQGCLSGSVGMPLPGTRLQIVGKDGELLPLGVSGSIWLGGVQVGMSLGQAAPKVAGERVFKDAQGQHWLDTGRQGQLNEEGFLLLAPTD